MYEYEESPTRYAWIVYAVGLLMVGGLSGYIVASTSRSSSRMAPAPPPVASSAGVTLADESELRAYREILARDPNNLPAAVKAANLLYDAQRYVEAIGFYQQAFALNPSDVNISTDLGTALWYAGRPDDALKQYDASLRIDPKHPQTLFNAGIVRADGKRDYAGAIQIWETLLETTPGYPAAARVQSLIADAWRSVGATR